MSTETPDLATVPVALSASIVALLRGKQLIRGEDLDLLVQHVTNMADGEEVSPEEKNELLVFIKWVQRIKGAFS